jgi:hypothetical protein
MILGSAQPPTSIRKPPGDKGQPVSKAGKLTVICESMSRKCGSLDVLQPYGSPRHVTGTALPFTFTRYGAKYQQVSRSKTSDETTLTTSTVRIWRRRYAEAQRAAASPIKIRSDDG